MSEEPKSIWKKSWHGPRGYIFGIKLLSVAVFLLIVTSALIYGYTAEAATVAGIFISVLILSAVTVGLLICLTRGFFSKGWRSTLIRLTCFATLIAIFYAEEDWRGKHDWEKFKQEWEAKGERFDFSSVIPKPVPDDQNFALTPVVASCYEHILDRNGKRIVPPNTNVVDRLAMEIESSVSDLMSWPTNGHWLRQTKTDLSGWQQFYRALAAKTNEFQVPAQPQSPAADVLLALSKYNSTIEELRAASRLPYSRFPLNYDSEHPFDTLLPHLAAMKNCSKVLQLRTIAELQAGETDKALTDVTLTLRLTETFRTDPFLISQLVRIAMTEITLQPIYEGLAERRWSDEQLVALDAELAKLDFLADYRFSMRGERAETCATIDYISKEQSYQRYQALFVNMWANESVTLSGQFKNTAKAVGIYLMPAGWFAQNKICFARREQSWITGAIFPKEHLASPQKHREVDQAESKLYNSPARPWNFLAKKFLPALGAAGRKSCREQISVDLARTAIALERYRLARGEFPESLDVLAPQFIAQVPHDVIGGQPLHYRRTADGQFVLYSVGWNEKDDGGIVFIPKGGSQAKFDEGDWVWRYPTK